MIRKLSPLAVAATLLAVSLIPASAGAKGDSFAPVFVTLNAVGGSRQSGRAIMRQIGPQVVISGTVANESPTALEPTRLRKGSCGSNGAVLSDLGMLTRGILGTTVVPGHTIAQLHAMHASIVISKSDKELGAVVACGNL